MGGILAALRAGQWIKNVLLFAPLVLSHQINEPGLWMAAAAGFAIFCLAASSVYLINDLLDLEADRRHPLKKTRPLAAGRISPTASLAASAALTLAACASSWVWMPFGFTLSLLAYLVLAHLYSLALKRVVLVDVFVLATLYGVRLVAGGQATAVEISPWLLALTIFLFVSLAFAKRCSGIRRHSKAEIRRRGYLESDLSMLETFGAVSGFLSVLVLALYINSEVVSVLYPRPWLLWPVCLLLMFWIARVWLLVRRGELQGDPLVFLAKDPASYLTGALTAALGLAASL